MLFCSKKWQTKIPSHTLPCCQVAADLLSSKVVFIKKVPTYFPWCSSLSDERHRINRRGDSSNGSVGSFVAFYVLTMYNNYYDVDDNGLGQFSEFGHNVLPPHPHHLCLLLLLCNLP